ncbi:MAG: hypothetical protein CSA74_12555 [Rhodobacterales bacterium]|nr:MAG: hypothetical protein CSA74_12555 [Rhodobacterales bacterium]
MDEETPLAKPDAALIRYLKTLVTALSVTMIAGVIVLVSVVVMRFNATTAPVAFPGSIALPEGSQAQAVTRGPGYLLVVTADGRALVFSPDGQSLRQEIALAPAPPRHP